MLRTVICTGPPILENRIIPLTYADALLHKVSRLYNGSSICNKTDFIDKKTTYVDLRLRLPC